MSYQIRYETEKSRMYPMKHIRFGRKRVLAYVGIAIITLALGSVRCVREFLIPGDPDDTCAAFSRMITNLQSGDSIGNAITTFCSEIISDVS